MTIIKECFKKPYVFWLIGIMLFYITLNIVISQFYITAQYIPYYFEQIKWLSLLLSAILSISIAFLVAWNMVAAYIYFNHLKHYKQQNPQRKIGVCLGKTGTASTASTVITTFGSVGGLATGICSACTSIFPLLLSSSGITLTWTTLPLKGLEIQGIVVILLIFNLYSTGNKNNRT